MVGTCTSVPYFEADPSEIEHHAIGILFNGVSDVEKEWMQYILDVDPEANFAIFGCASLAGK